MSDSLEESSLLYRSIEPAGKLAITPTKPLAKPGRVISAVGARLILRFVPTASR